MKSTAFLLLALLPLSIYAQPPRIHPLPLPDSKNPIGRVNCMFQDKNGFIWIGKETGLYRYDGNEMKSFPSNAADSTTIANNNILAISGDSQGNLWIGTKGGGLNKYDPRLGKFTRYVHNDGDPGSLSFNEVMEIVPDGAGHFWVGTDGGGLNFFDPVTGKFQAFPTAGIEGSGFRSNKIIKISSAGKGKYWVGTWGGGIHLFDATSKKIRHLGDGTPYGTCNVFGLQEVRPGLVWVATWDQGLLAYDVQSDRFSNLIDQTLTSHYRDIHLGSNGEIWVNSTIGLLHFKSPTASYEQVADDAPASFRDITSILIDKTHIIWAGYKSGVVGKLDPGAKTFFTLPSTVPFNSSPVPSVFADTSTDQIYFSTWKNLIQYSPATKTAKNWPLPVTELASISEMAGCDSLLCAAPAALMIFNKKNGQFSAPRFETIGSAELLKREVLTVVAKPGLHFWIGASGVAYEIIFDRSAGLWKISNIFYAAAGKSLPPSHYASTFTEDNQGNLWIGTFGAGLNKLIPGTSQFTNYKHEVQNPGSMADNFVECAINAGNAIWAGTHAGLSRFDLQKNQFRNFKTIDGLSSDWINSIYQDGKKRTWMGTANGISCLAASLMQVHQYDVDDGLPSNTFMSRSVAADRKGYLYFGTSRGLVWFHPDSIGASTFLPDPVLVDLKINEVSVQPGAGSALASTIEFTDHLELSSDQSSFSLQMAALGYFNPLKNALRYQLEGYDTGWKVAGANRLAVYSAIPPGTYQFRLMAGNEDGIWNSNQKILTIVIAPPAWRSGSALFIYFSLLAACTVLFYIIRRAKVEISLPEPPPEKGKRLPNHDIIQPAEIIASASDLLFLNKAISIVEENMADPEFNVQQLSEKMFISRPQLYRKITAITGVTITDFIKEIRLKRAAQLIIQKPGNISEIAYQVGFNDPKYFSKCFKQHFGVPPGAYNAPNERFLPLK